MNEKDTEYENNNIAYDYTYTEEVGGGIKCKNYELCTHILPKCWFKYHGHYLCSECHMLFGTWGKSHTGKGVLEIFELQIEGKKKMQIKDFLRGSNMISGEFLGQ